jgi:hypothetical protein
VDLSASVVTVAEGALTGLGMLGVRPRRTWITRLGVLPTTRRSGQGRAIMEALLAQSDRLGATEVVLEVIKNNAPAYNLFVRCGFEEIRELLILRRPPAPPQTAPTGEFRWLAREEALDLLSENPHPQSWITDKASLELCDHILGMTGRLPDGSEGWVVFQEQRFRLFPKALARLTLYTRHGDPVRMGKALLNSIYHQYPELDTQVENILVDDPHLPALFDLGYVESFRRIEMRRLTSRSVL